ncbi:MAG: phasin family protein [Acidobacteriota bacterium]
MTDTPREHDAEAADAAPDTDHQAPNESAADDAHDSAHERVGDELKDAAQRIWLAGLGAMATAEDEGSKLFQRLVERGRTYRAQGRDAVHEAGARAEEAADDVRSRVEEATDDVRSRVEEAADELKHQLSDARGRVESLIDDAVQRALQRAGVPSRDEIATLVQRVEELTRKIEAFGRDQADR